VLSHSGFFAIDGIDGDTDQELVAAASAGYVTLSSSLSLDGEAIPLRPLDTGAFDVTSEPGSFYDTRRGCRDRSRPDGPPWNRRLPASVAAG
jgi:hypothetical protein